MLLSNAVVTVTRAAGGGDPYEAATVTTVTTSTPGQISSPSGADFAVASKEVIDAVLYLFWHVGHKDPTPALQVGDVVTDDLGRSFRVTWAFLRRGLGLDHQQAGLVSVRGASG